MINKFSNVSRLNSHKSVVFLHNSKHTEKEVTDMSTQNAIKNHLETNLIKEVNTLKL